MEKRELNVSFYKSGTGGVSSRISLPKKWMDLLGIDSENKKVEVVFDEEQQKIIIYKKK